MAGVVKTVRIGTRGSPLALAQTELVRLALLSSYPGLGVEIVRIQTKGDRLLDRPLADLGDKGLFIAEIEDALKSGRIDCAVHSSKDMPSELTEGMELATFLPRADARDVLVARDPDVREIRDLPKNAKIGTGSPRRRCQILSVRHDLELLDVRGNVGTRLQKMNDGQYDAIILAAAGLDRLNISDINRIAIPVDTMIPAVGQGAVCIEIASDRGDMRSLLEVISDKLTAREVNAERAFLKIVGGGCHAAVAAHAVCVGSSMSISAMIGSATSGLLVKENISVDVSADPDAAGKAATQIAARLLLTGRALLQSDKDADGKPQSTPSA